MLRKLGQPTLTAAEKNFSDVSIMECIVYRKPKFRELLSTIYEYVELNVNSARLDIVCPRYLGLEFGAASLGRSFINSPIRKVPYFLFISALLLFIAAVDFLN